MNYFIFALRESIPFFIYIGIGCVSVVLFLRSWKKSGTLDVIHDAEDVAIDGTSEAYGNSRAARTFMQRIIKNGEALLVIGMIVSWWYFLAAYIYSCVKLIKGLDKEGSSKETE